jgi:hypothetical protein
MRRTLAQALAAALLLSLAGNAHAAEPPYARAILRDHPAGYWTFDDPRGSSTASATAGTANGSYAGDPATVRGVSGLARRYDGGRSYATIPDRPAWRQPTAGALTVEFWMRPDRLVFANEEGSGYVWVVGKGGTGQQEWAFRMYGSDNTESPPRANRISFYAYPLAGGQGPGAYFQEPVLTGRWIYVVGELTKDGVRIYRDGELTEGPEPPTRYSHYHVTLRDGTAPVRVGTRDLHSFFAGTVDELAIYPSLLSQRQIDAHYHAGLAALKG